MAGSALPTSPDPRPAARYEYWMFEGIRPDIRSNLALHVTSEHNDDPLALSMLGGSEHAISLRGCRDSVRAAIAQVEGLRAP
ncbi:poly-gamma-glutamate hydrolase family protein [Longispora fulva]|uniref:poly-gamma-glutamate hydrolase family protein n=1 Tax=Longispora fulva TaxID=619741 RepID=UPI00227977A2|nr:poly-gamma-glutamate hydrolase family protein [Longispora fulva]